MAAFDQLKGKVKEAVGSVSGSDDLRAEGQEQQLKADAEREAERARLEAEKHEERAERHEDAESRHQGS